LPVPWSVHGYKNSTPNAQRSTLNVQSSSELRVGRWALCVGRLLSNCDIAKKR
jgi:hypothetical protein